MNYLRHTLTLLLVCSALQAETTATAEKVGASAATALKKNLMGALGAALNRGDIAGAIEICSSEAMPLTAKSAEVDPAVLSIHRRTDRWRNPANQADRIDAKAMHHFRKDKSLTEWTIDESDQIARYYQPLRIAPMCLNCHGDPDTFTNEVKEALGSHYGEDRAIGYTEGELRGVIQVRIDTTPNAEQLLESR